MQKKKSKSWIWQCTICVTSLGFNLEQLKQGLLNLKISIHDTCCQIFHTDHGYWKIFLVSDKSCDLQRSVAALPRLTETQCETFEIYPLWIWSHNSFNNFNLSDDRVVVFTHSVVILQKCLQVACWEALIWTFTNLCLLFVPKRVCGISLLQQAWLP